MTRKIIPALLVAAGFMFLIPAQHLFAVPTGPHCVDSGPASLPLDYCGCTWGGIYYRGRAIEDVPVSLMFSRQITNTLTKSASAEDFPFYIVEGHFLGAELNDMMSVTTQVMGQTVTRSFRARPNNQGEQEIPLVIPEQGSWAQWLSMGHNRTLAVQGERLWAGGVAGLVAIDPAIGISTTHTLPWVEAEVVALSANSSTIWAAGPSALALYEDDEWKNHPLPFAAPLRVLAIDATSSALWVGGWESLNDIGLLAAYTDKWQPVTAVSETVRAIALDEEGNAWVGTWGGGVYRHDSTVADVNGGWTQYTVKDGLASDEIYDIVIDGNTVWVAANSYKSNGQSFGGVSSFNQMSGQWRTFAQPHGLPADPRDASLPAPMYAVAVGANQDIWVGTVAIVNGAEADAVYRLITSDLWVQDSTEANNRVHALAVVGNNVIAAGNSRMLHLDQSMTPGSPPTVQMQTEPMTITLDATLVLTATATDQDEGGGTILGWEWTSERAGHICTTAERCVIPSQILGEGMHQIGLRVQDDEGIWSQKEAVQIVVTVPPEQPEETIYLPLIRR